MPVLVLITRVIHRSTLHFAVARKIVYKSNTREKNLTGRKCGAYLSNRQQVSTGYLTIIPFALVGYEMVNSQRGP